MKESLTLRDATVQEIQLELIRRTGFNAFDGERIYAALMNHRELWLAVLLDRPGLANYAEPSSLLMAGLIKLRDLDENLWNADTLFVLTRNHQDARRFAQIAEAEGWAEEVRVHENQKEIDMALGTGRDEFGLVTIWWD